MKDFTLDDTTVKRIADKFELGSISFIEKFDSGLMNPSYLLERQYVLRIEMNKYIKDADRFKKESLLYQLLPHFDIPTPSLIGFDDSKEIIDYPYILLKYIPGENLKQSFSKIGKNQQTTFSYQFGEIAHKIHSITLSELGGSIMFGNMREWVQTLHTDFETYWSVVKESKHLSSGEKTSINNTFNHFQKLKLDDTGTLIHGDYNTSNFQINQEKIVGIFDFEYATIGDPLFDLQRLPVSFQLGSGFKRDEFLKGYDIKSFTDDEKIRLKMYCFHQGVWELWATITKFMPFGDKDIEEGKDYIKSTLGYTLLN